jgi:hypothetical protein
MFQFTHHQTLHIFPHSFIILNNFCDVGRTGWRATNVIWALEAKGTMCEYSHLNTIIGELLENNGKFCSSQGCKWRYGSKVKYISMIIIVHWLLCWYNFHTQCQLLMYISSWIQYDVHHSWMKKSLYLMDKIINDQYDIMSLSKITCFIQV